MKKIVLFLVLICQINFAQNPSSLFTTRVVNPGSSLNSPWNILYGPNDSLWITLNFDYKVIMMSIATGNFRTILDLTTTKNNVINAANSWPQGGLMGMVLHPNFYAQWPNPTNNFIYLAYTYKYVRCDSSNLAAIPCFFKTMIGRFNYNANTKMLNFVDTLIANLPGSNDHNGGRLTIGADNKLYYTIGDMGAGQFNNLNRTQNAQNTNIYEGKTLRLNLLPDVDAFDANDRYQKFIPNDNPYTNGTIILATFTYGHRNPQGITLNTFNNRLYEVEHGPQSDDETNALTSSFNYGWPRVAGYCDGNYNGLTLGGYSGVNESLFCNDSINNKNTQPFGLMGTISASPNTLGSGYLTWPTVAPSSIKFYGHGCAYFLRNTLVITTLKAGKIIYARINNTENNFYINDTTQILAARGKGRYRDVCFNPSGDKIYVACDKSGQTSGPTGGFNGGGTPPPNAGKILEFLYIGPINNTEEY